MKRFLDAEEIDIFSEIDEDGFEKESLEEKEATSFSEFPITREDAVKYIEEFFADKKWVHGGPIPKKELIQDRHVDMILSLEFHECVDFFYQSVEQIKEYNEFEPAKDLLIELQNNSCRLGIPKHHSGGLMLIYLILCQGITL